MRELAASAETRSGTAEDDLSLRHPDRPFGIQQRLSQPGA